MGSASEWTPWSRRLAATLVEDSFGEMVGEVAATLAQGGAMTLDAILATTNAALASGNAAVGAHSARGVFPPSPELRLTRRQVCDCLLILIQHGLVGYEFREREAAVGAMSNTKSSKLGPMPQISRPALPPSTSKADARNFFYMLELRAVLHRLAFPRMAAYTRQRFGGEVGELAAALLVALHQHGCLPMEEAVDAAVSVIFATGGGAPLADEGPLGMGGGMGGMGGGMGGGSEGGGGRCGGAEGGGMGMGGMGGGLVSQTSGEHVRKLRAQLVAAWGHLANGRYIQRVETLGGAGLAAAAAAAAGAGARAGAGANGAGGYGAADGDVNWAGAESELHPPQPAAATQPARGRGRGRAGGAGRGRGAAKEPPPAAGARQPSNKLGPGAEQLAAAALGKRHRRHIVVEDEDGEDEDEAGGAGAGGSRGAPAKRPHLRLPAGEEEAGGEEEEGAQGGAGSGWRGAVKLEPRAARPAGAGAAGASARQGAPAAPAAVLWRIHAAQFLREFRHALIAQLAAQKCDQMAGAVVAAVLGALRGDERSVRDGRTAAFSASQLVARCQAEAERSAHERDGLLMALPAPAEGREAHERLGAGGARARAREGEGEGGDGDDDDVDEEAAEGGGALSAAGGGRAGAGSIDGCGRGRGRGGGLSAPAPAGSSLGTVDEALAALSQTSAVVGALDRLLRDGHVRLLSAAHGAAASGLGGSLAPLGVFSMVRLEMASAIAHVRLRSLEELVALRFGKPAARILRVVRAQQKADERAVATSALLPVKECRALLYKLMQAGFLQLVEVPKSAERTPQRTIYLWGCELAKATAAAHTELVSSLLRLQLRLRAERRWRTSPSAAGGSKVHSALTAAVSAQPELAEQAGMARLDARVVRQRRLQALEHTMSEMYESLLVFLEF